MVVAPDTGAAPAVLQTSPADGASGVQATAVTASFSRALKPSTLTGSSFTLTAPDGSSVPASVSYDGAYLATLTPSVQLAVGTTYTAHLAETVADANGTPMGAPVAWSFTTGSCPCALFSDLAQPANQSAAGTFELGVKLQVDSPEQLTSVRFYKAVGETGNHMARGTANGLALGSDARERNRSSAGAAGADDTVAVQQHHDLHVPINAIGRCGHAHRLLNPVSAARTPSPTG